ncbi:MAG TPA: transcriptional repressor LexA [Pyrinomonadaceae bacterium]|nr:transcriptional repressor LexA [Pyrinomonadaceae bacterium]
MQPRTKRQREVLDYITSFIAERGYEPSYQQIARHFKIASKSAIAKHIAALETQGLLSRQRENGSFGLQVRTNQITSESVYQIQWLEVPVKDNFEEDWENENFFIPDFMLGYADAERIRAFRVRDDAMRGEHICEGDVALVEKKSYARDGDNVVAIVENKQILLMKYYRQGANIEFQSANPNYPSLFYSADEITILGVVRGILRPIS